eukprot:m.95909 g.95909  ORF g.95909 m.95909 type:complete len:171 (+) comp15170_c0_seq2:63-575(+)
MAANRLSGLVAKVKAFTPAGYQPQALSALFGFAIPFVGTSGLRVNSVDKKNISVSLKNKRKVQNHIGSVHAAAMALVAESATGFLVGMNVPDSKVPVIKKMEIDYVKRCSGDLSAKAWLTEEQIKLIETEPKGEVSVACEVQDSKGVSPIKTTMVWAWTPKRREHKPADT